MQPNLRMLLMTLGVILFSFVTISVFGQVIQTDKPDYVPGEYVVITGSEWMPGETVALKIVSDCGCTNVTYNAAANANGEIYSKDFLIKEAHLGAWFTVTAYGTSSGLQSITYFTDASFVSKSSGDWNSPSTWIKTLQGTISVNNNSTLVTGAGTSFTTEISIGDVLYTTTGLIGTVASIANNTSLTLSSNNSGSKSGVGYGREGVPTSSDNVTISGGHSVVVTSDASCSTLIVNATSHATPLVINSNVELSVSGSINFTQSSNNQSTISVGSGTLSAGSISLSGGSGNRIAEISVGTGTVTVSGNLSFSGTSTNARFTFTNAGTLQIAGTLGLAGTINNGSGTLGTIEYNGLGAQSILAIPYNNLTTSGSGTKALSGATTVNGVCTIGSSTTLDISSRTMTMPSGSSIQVNGILDFSDASGVLQSGTSGTATLTIGSAGTIKTLDAAGLGPAPNTAPLPSIVTQTGGSWNTVSIANNGTVEYYRSSAQTVTDLNYNNLVFTNAGAKSWTPAAARSVNGNLTLNTNASLTIASGTIDIRGNLTNDGNFNLGSSTIILDGNAVQSISGGNATSFNNLTVNNSSGVTINQTVLVNGVLVLTNGIVSNPFVIFRINASGSITGGSSSSYVDGILQQVYAATGSKTFPIGKAGNYRPVTLNYTSLTGTSTVDASQLESGFTGTFPLGTSQLGTRFWTVRQVGASAFTYNITLDASGFSPTGDVKILKFNAPSTNAILSTTGTAPYYTASGLSSFSDFALGHVTNTAPVVTTPQAETTNEDVAKTITPSVTDAENDPLAFEIVTNPTHGSVVINGDGTFTYTPASDYYGPDVFTYKAKDDKNEYSDVATVNLTIVSVNDAPAGANKTVNTNEDVDYTFTTFDFGFTDVDGNSLLAVKLTTLPTAGNLTLNGSNITVAGTSIAVADITAGNLKFHPVANANGTAYTSFTFQVQDNGGTANSGVDLDPSAKTMTIDVTPVNDAPTLSNVTKASEKEDVPVTFTATNFSDQFADLDGNTLTKIKITSLATHGTLQLSGVPVVVDQEIAVANIGDLSFVPDANYHGAASFGWNGNDGTAYAASAALVNITLASVNDAPSGNNNTVTTLEDNDYIFKPSDFGFTDPNDDPANAFSAVKLASLPSTGNLTLNGSVISSIVSPISYTDINAGNFKFHPSSNGNGTNYASFTFQVKDDGGTSNSGVDLDPSANSMQINVTPVSDAPAGANGSVSATEDQDYVFTLADFGFTDPNDNPANNFNAVTIPTLPLNGTLTLSGSSVSEGATIIASDISSGNLKFRAANNANGNNYASFTFQVEDDGSTDNGGAILDPTANTITINVAAVNDAPTVANAIDDLTVNEDASNTVINLASTFADVDGDNLTVTVHNNSNSTLVTASYNAGTKELTLHYNTDKHGSATITIRASDGNLSVDDQFAVTVRSVNDAPAGTNKTVNIDEDNSYTFSASDFGFTDPKDDDPANNLLAVKITTVPANGTLKLGSTNVSAGNTIPAASIGSLVFTPANNANGSPYTTFTFQVQDNGGTAYDGADMDPTPRTVTINVAAVNDAPTVSNVSKSGTEDVTVTFSSNDFTSHYSDIENTALASVKITSLPLHGTLKLNNVSVAVDQVVPASDLANLTLVPEANYNGNISFGWNGSDGSLYAASVATVTITLAPVNDAPTVANAVADVTVNEDAVNTVINLTNTFADVDGDNLAISITNNTNTALVTASYSSVTKQLTLQYAGNKHGPATITLEASDGVLTVQDQFLVTVNSVNDAPAGGNKTVSTLEDVPYTFTASDFNFTDPDDNPANSLYSVKVSTLATAGTLKLNGNPVNQNDYIPVSDIEAGNFKFYPALNANGNAYASFTFQVRDNGGTANGGVDLDPTPNTITIDVTPVNDAPAGADKTVTTLEDNDYIFSAPDFGFTDIDGNSLLAVKITMLPGAGTLTNNGAAVSADQFISIADINANKLKFSPATNANGSAYANFKFKVQDNGGTANDGVDLDPTANTITIDVTAVNDAPTVSNVSKPGTEDVTITFALSDFTSQFSDVDGDQLNKIKITSLPAHGTLKLGAANVNVDQEILSTSIANLTFVPELNYNGNTGFGWNGYDGTVCASTGASVNISLQAVNDAPNVANAIGDVTVNEDAANTVINLANTFADVDADALTVTVNNNSNTSLLTANYDATTKNLTLHYNANKNGSAIITIRASDGSLYVDDQFNVTVHSVNDEPSGADNIVTISEDGNYPFAAADFGFTDANDAPSANSLLAVKITTLPGAGTLKNNGANVSAGTFVSAADITAGKLVFAPAANANDTPYASFTFQVQDDGGVAYYGANTDQTANNFTINVTPVNDAPVVSITNAALSVQYSDPIAATTITATDVDNSYSDLKISSSYVLGSTTYPGLPTGLSLTAASGSGNTQTWSLTGNMMVAPGKYTITFTVTDQTANAANNSGTTSIEITVGKEDAKIEYTGLQFVSTPSIDICKAKVVLRASVVDATAFATTDAKYDGNEGDVSNMRVTFKVYTQGGTTPIKVYPDVQVTYVDPSNKKIGIVSIEHEFTISNCSTGYDIFDVEVCPGTGFYQADKDKDNVTVSKPMNDFITGGGNILATQAAGKLAQNYPLLPQETGKMNFGFNVKWNKTYKNPQGNMNIIIRRNGKIFQVKANQMTSLTVGGAACSRTGTFIGSANIADVTTDVAQSIPGIKGGGLSLEVTMTDNYLTGTKDLVGMSLWDGSTLIYSSNWSGTKTVEKVLNGGNLEAHNGMVCTSALITSSAPVRETNVPSALADAPEGLSVTAYPNPSTNRFTVKLQSNDHVQSLKLVVYDVNGKVVETRQSLVAGQTVQLGALYRPGVYVLEMIQGTQHKQVKLVKIPD